MEKSTFEKHPVWAALTELESLLDAAEDRGEAAATAPLASLRYLAAAARSHSEPSDTGPYTNTGLQNVQNSLSPVAQEIRNYVSNGNVGHLANAQTHADTALYHVGLWPTSILKGGAAAQANKVFMEYRGAAEEALKSLRETNQALRVEIDQRRAEWAATVQALSADVAGLTESIKQDEARLNQALTTNNETFTAKQTEREEKFIAWLADQGKALKKLAADDLEVIKNQRVNADAAYADIDKLRDDTKTVAGLAAGDQVARGYRRYSLRQWVAGLVAYVVGFIALGAGAALVVLTIKGVNPGDHISWQFAVLKLGLTVSAVFGAVIAFRLGSHLLAEASTAKRFELELKALGPLFPHDDEQETLQSVKRDLVERSFGQGWRTDEKSKEVMNEKFVERIVEAVARAFVRPPGT